MAELLLDDLDVDPAGQGQRGGEVTQVMQAYRRQVKLPDESTEPVGQVLGPDPATILLGSGWLLGQSRDTAMAFASITVTGGASSTQTPGQAAGPLTSTLVTTFVTSVDHRDGSRARVRPADDRQGDASARRRKPDPAGPR